MLLCNTAVKRCLVSTKIESVVGDNFPDPLLYRRFVGDNMRRFILHAVLCLGCAFASCLNVASAASNGSETSSPLDEEAGAAYWQDELNRYHLLGRAGFGALTGVGIVAAIGDSTRALEKGHNAIDSLAKGITGNRKP
jgi:hypothetical protein